MVHIALNSLVPFLPSTIPGSDGQFTVNESDARNVAQRIEQHVNSLPAESADLFLALLTPVDLGPKPGTTPADPVAQQSALQTSADKIADFMGLSQDANMLAKLMVMHAHEQQKNALDQRLASREEAKRQQLHQSSEMKDSAKHLRTGAITSLVLSVVSATVSIAMAGGSMALSARAASRLNQVGNVAAPKPPAAPEGPALAGSPQPKPADLDVPGPSLLDAGPDGAAPNGAVSKEGQFAQVEPDGADVAKPADAAAQEGASVATAASAAATVATPQGGAGAANQGSGGPDVAGPAAPKDGGSVQAGDSTSSEGMTPSEELQFQANMKSHDVQMAQISAINTKAQNFATIGGISNTLGQASSSFATSYAQADSKTSDADAAVAAAAAEDENATGDLAKNIQESASGLVEKMMQLVRDLQNAKAEQMQSMTRV